MGWWVHFQVLICLPCCFEGQNTAASSYYRSRNCLHSNAKKHKKFNHIFSHLHEWKLRSVQTCNGVALRNRRRPFRLDVPEDSEPCVTAGSRSEGYSERMNLGLVTSRGPSLKSKSSYAHTAIELRFGEAFDSSVLGQSLKWSCSCGRDSKAGCFTRAAIASTCLDQSTVSSHVPEFKHQLATFNGSKFWTWRVMALDAS